MPIRLYHNILCLSIGLMRTFPFLSQHSSKKSQFTPCCPRFLCSPDVRPQPMGHANISLTLQLYAHSTVETKQNAMRCMEKHLCFPFHWGQTFPFTRKMNPFTHISCIFTPKTMNTSTSVAGGCHHAGIALCSSQCVKRIITICQLRKIISGYP